MSRLIFSAFLLFTAFSKWRTNKPTSPTLEDEQIVAQALKNQAESESKRESQ
jgi:hypothetical protein